MRKIITAERHTGIVFSVAAAVMTGSAVSVAGPGCMVNQQQMYRGHYPTGPMMPQSAYRPGPPPAYRDARAAYMGTMASRYPQHLPAQRANPAAVVPRAAAVAAAETTRVNASVQTGNGESASATENVTVRINGMRFEPSSVTVKPGTTVTWVHGSNMPHTVSGQADGLRSSTLYGGQQFSHTFDATGRYDYACDFHPSMKGRVTVEAQDT